MLEFPAPDSPWRLKTCLHTKVMSVEALESIATYSFKRRINAPNSPSIVDTASSLLCSGPADKRHSSLYIYKSRFLPLRVLWPSVHDESAQTGSSRDFQMSNQHQSCSAKSREVVPAMAADYHPFPLWCRRHLNLLPLRCRNLQ